MFGGGGNKKNIRKNLPVHIAKMSKLMEILLKKKKKIKELEVAFCPVLVDGLSVLGCIL